MKRRNFLSLLPFIGVIPRFDSNLGETTSEFDTFIEVLERHPDRFCSFTMDPQEPKYFYTRRLYLHVTYIGIMGNGEYYRCILQFIAPDGTSFIRNSDIYKVDIIGKSDVNQIQADNIMLTSKIMMRDIKNHYFPENIKLC